MHVNLPRGPPEVALVEKLTGSLYWCVEQCVPTTLLSDEKNRKKRRFLAGARN